MEEEVLGSKRNHLIKIIQDLFEESTPHSRAFTLRVLSPKYETEIGLDLGIDEIIGETDYGGYPELASLGFEFGVNRLVTKDDALRFLEGINRLKSRSPSGLATLSVDDLALLGIAEGLTKLDDGWRPEEVSRAKDWLLTIIDKPSDKKIWSSRLRDLAGDLLDNRGRVRILPSCSEVSVGALDVVVRYVWQEIFTPILIPPWAEYKQLFMGLLSQPIEIEDLEKTVVWLRAIDLLFEQSCDVLFPKTDKEALAISELTTIKAKLDKKAEREAKLAIWLYVGFILSVIILLFALNYRFTWDVMEPWTYFISISMGLFGMIYFAVTAREFSVSTFYGQILASKKRKFYKKVDFSLEVFERLV